MALRAAVCRTAAIRRGRRWCCPLIDALADFGAISDALPYPSQVELSRRLGVHERTVRRWLADLEELGLVLVLRSWPVRGEDGRWTRRQSNRYLLTDRKAGAATGLACPLPRRRSPLLSPTGRGCPVTATESSTSGGALVETAAPPPPVDVGRAEPPTPAPQAGDQGEQQRITAIRAAIRSQLGQGRRRW
jgi:DNA-binding transcriptional ArsR family regulator